MHHVRSNHGIHENFGGFCCGVWVRMYAYAAPLLAQILVASVRLGTRIGQPERHHGKCHVESCCLAVSATRL